MTLERILLQTIKFDLQVEHPYSYLIKYAKCLKGELNSSLCVLNVTACGGWIEVCMSSALAVLLEYYPKFNTFCW